MEDKDKALEKFYVELDGLRAGMYKTMETEDMMEKIILYTETYMRLNHTGYEFDDLVVFYDIINILKDEICRRADVCKKLRDLLQEVE